MEPALGSVQKDPGLGPILRALGFEEAQRCWLEGKGSGWSKVRAPLCSVQLRNTGRMGEFSERARPSGLAKPERLKWTAEKCPWEIGVRNTVENVEETHGIFHLPCVLSESQ